MWNVLDRFAENVRIYSTPVGQLWNTVNFVFRLFVIVAVGSSVYGDEQGAFKCDTGQPGCQNVCFNRFSPISHMRFWAFQILFVSTPPIFFYLYAGMQTGRVKKLEAEKAKLKKDTQALQEETEKLMEANGEDDDGTKSHAILSMYGEKNQTLKETEKRVDKLSKKVGRYKEKQVNQMAKGGELTQVIFTTKVKIVYILHCILKFGIELVFLYLGYILQQQQSLKTGWNAWEVPEKYTCTHAKIYGAAGSACAQQEKVTCWVSRPFEKQYFLFYMLTMTGISMALTIIEALYMAFHVTKKGVQRRAAKDNHKQAMNNTMFNGYDASNFHENMMTMRSNKGIKSGLTAANSFRYNNRMPGYGNNTGRNSLAPSYHAYMADPRFQYAGAPILDEFLPDGANMMAKGFGKKGMVNPMMAANSVQSPGYPHALGQANFNQQNMQNPLHDHKPNTESIEEELEGIDKSDKGSSNKENQKQ